MLTWKPTSNPYTWIDHIPAKDGPRMHLLLMH